MPNIGQELTSSVHSLRQPKCDQFDELDLLRINDQVWKVIKGISKQLNFLKELTTEDILKLKKVWFKKCQNIMNSISMTLPPIWKINYQISLIELNKIYNYHLS